MALYWPMVALSMLSLLAQTGAARAADILINNGLDCINPGNVIDDSTYQLDSVYVRNVGCGTPDPWSECSSPGAATEVCLGDGGQVFNLIAHDTSLLTVTGGTVLLDLTANESSTVTMNGSSAFVSNVLQTNDLSNASINSGVALGVITNHSSTVTVNGGMLGVAGVGGSLFANDTSVVTIEAATMHAVLEGRHSSTITINNGTGEYLLFAYDTSVVTMNGGGANGLRAHDSSALTMNGGTAGYLLAYDTSTVSIGGGTINGALEVNQFANATMSGGIVAGVLANDTSIVTVDGATIEGSLEGHHLSSITMNSGVGPVRLITHDTSNVMVNGGVVTGSEWFPLDSSTITVSGDSFEVDGVPVPYGDLSALSGTLAGTLLNGDSIFVFFFQGGGSVTGTITLSPPNPVPSLGPLAIALLGCLLGAAGIRRLRADSEVSTRG